MEGLVVQALTGVLSAAVGSFSSYKLLEWRIGKLENQISSKMDADLCKERRATCDPCRKSVAGVVETQENLVHCVNKYVDDCKVRM
jgi:hypothetical protein